MRIIGCDLHAAQQTIAMLDDDTGERIERTLKHEGVGGSGFLRQPGATGGRGDRSDRFHGLVFAIDGGAADYVPRWSSREDSRDRNAAAKTRSA